MGVDQMWCFDFFFIRLDYDIHIQIYTTLLGRFCPAQEQPLQLARVLVGGRQHQKNTYVLNKCGCGSERV